MNYKGYLITAAQGIGAAYEIATEGRGGKIPNVLGGIFTSRSVAMQAIDSYLLNKESSLKQNDKESGKG